MSALYCSVLLLALTSSHPPLPLSPLPPPISLQVAITIFWLSRVVRRLPNYSGPLLDFDPTSLGEVCVKHWFDSTTVQLGLLYIRIGKHCRVKSCTFFSSFYKLAFIDYRSLANNGVKTMSKVERFCKSFSSTKHGYKKRPLAFMYGL